MSNLCVDSSSPYILLPLPLPLLHSHHTHTHTHTHTPVYVHEHRYSGRTFKQVQNSPVERTEPKFTRSYSERAYRNPRKDFGEWGISEHCRAKISPWQGTLKCVHTENAPRKSIITSLSGTVGGRCWYQAVSLHTPVHTTLAPIKSAL